MEPPDEERKSAWDEQPGHPIDDWIYEVGNRDTTLGYLEWCAARRANRAAEEIERLERELEASNTRVARIRERVESQMSVSNIPMEAAKVWIEALVRVLDIIDEE